MTHRRIALLASLAMLVTAAITTTAASAMTVKLGPAAEEVSNGIIEPGESKEFTVENATKENVKITNIVLKPVIEPMVLEFLPPIAPECEVAVELAKAAKCNDKVKDTAAKKGGEAQYIIEASKANKWKTVIKWL